MWTSPLPLLAASAVPPPLVWIDDQTVSAASEVIIKWGDLAFEEVYILSDQIIPATANAGLVMRLSSDNGATFDSGAGDYQNISVTMQAGQGRQAGAASTMVLVQQGSPYGLTTAAYGSFLTTVHRPYDASERTVVSSVGGNRTPAAAAEGAVQQYGFREVPTRVNAIRFSGNPGSISGRFQAWGLVI